MSLKIGDRCVVQRHILNSPNPPELHRGQIVGECDDGASWIVRRDLFKHRAVFSKSAVYAPETLRTSRAVFKSRP